MNCPPTCPACISVIISTGHAVDRPGIGDVISARTSHSQRCMCVLRPVITTVVTTVVRQSLPVVYSRSRVAKRTRRCARPSCRWGARVGWDETSKICLDATLTSAAFEVGLATISHRITDILTACQAREIYDSELSAATPAEIEMPSHELQWEASHKC